MTNKENNSIVFKESLPATDDYWELFNTTNWNDNYKFIKSDLGSTIRNSWRVVSAYDKEKLVGFGRVISDGIHHALIVDMIIHPKYQNQGIGGLILEKLLKKCIDHKIRDIQLFAAKDKFGFYEKYNFKKRAEDAPGMQYQYTSGTKV